MKDLVNIAQAIKTSHINKLITQVYYRYTTGILQVLYRQTVDGGNNHSLRS